MNSNFQFYKTVYLNSVKPCIRRNIIWLLLIYLVLSYLLPQVTVNVMNTKWVIIGTVMGIILFSGNFQLEEIRFLWALGKRKSFLTGFMWWKKTPIIFLFICLLVGQLLWYPRLYYIVGQSLFMLLLGISYAELIVYVYFAPISMGKYRFLLWLWALLVLVIDLSIAIVPIGFIPMIISAITMTIIQVISAVWASQYAWLRLICTTPAKTTKVSIKRYMLSHYPLLRKELYFFFTRFKNMFLLFSVIYIPELIVFYTIDDIPEFGHFIAVLFIFFISQSFVFQSFATESKGLKLYIVTLKAWRTMLSTKWFFYWFLSVIIVFIHIIAWQFKVASPKMEWMLLLAKGTFFAATLVSLCLFLGYIFTICGQVRFIGSVVTTCLLSSLLYLYLAHFIWFILTSIVVHIGYFRLYRSIPTTIEAKY